MFASTRRIARLTAIIRGSCTESAAAPAAAAAAAAAAVPPSTKERQKKGVIFINKVTGLDHMKNPRINKGLAFTSQERQALGLQGLFPGSVKSQKEQIELCTFFCDRYKKPLNKYIYLTELQDTNERLFFSVLNTDIVKYLPIVYTPTVGLACQRFGLIYRRPRGLFVTIYDKGHIFNVLRHWPELDVKAICFTDGERILGLGDLGAYGMGIPVGKLALYTALAGIKPHQVLPVTLDVGTDNEKLLQDPLYIGIRRKRARGKEYDEFIDEFMHAAVERFGSQTLLQFEDFAYANAAPLLAKYREKFTSFNDDIQGTAGAGVAGLLAATRITKKKISEHITLFLGAGSASTGIADLMVEAMKDEGLSEEQCVSKIYMIDVNGLLSTQREGGVPVIAKRYGKDLPPEKDFENIVATLKPTILIGCSTVGGAFTPNILRMMAKNAERPIIFALSNPTSKAECTAQAAYDNTEGRCIFASGSPFPPVNYQGNTYITGQGNNSYIFPGVALGTILARPTVIPDKAFLIAAMTVAAFVKEEDLNKGSIYPPLEQIVSVSTVIAEKVIEFFYASKYATVYPKPPDLKKYIKNSQYQLEYPLYLPEYYECPADSEKPLKTIAEMYKSS